MDFSRAGVKQAYGASGVLYDVGSGYEGLSKLTDMRKAKGKIYRLETVMRIGMLAKLGGEDPPFAIADGAENHKEEIVQLLQLKRANMPRHHTIRRIRSQVVYQEEIERLVGDYNPGGDHGEGYARDGKAPGGMRRKDEEASQYLLSVYAVKPAKVMSQVEVGRKENEITKAPQALKLVEIAQNVITGAALPTQGGFSVQVVEAQGDYVLPVKENQPQVYKNIQAWFAPEYPKPGFGKLQTDFLTAQKVNTGHGRIEIRTITTREMLNTYAAWPGLAQVYRLERQFQWRRNGRSDRTSCEVEFGITSLTRQQSSPWRLLHLRRAPWGSETGLHDRRDVTMKEDPTRMTVGHTATVMASINNLALTLIRQAQFHNAAPARRCFAAHLSDTFALLPTPFSPS